MRFPPIIGVIGAGQAPPDVLERAEAVGREIALAGAWLVCGGLGGVMEAASRGAKAAGGFTIGILPGCNREDASPYIDVPISWHLRFPDGREADMLRAPADAVRMALTYLNDQP